jgi:hypothetical protein
LLPDHLLGLLIEDTLMNRWLSLQAQMTALEGRFMAALRRKDDVEAKAKSVKELAKAKNAKWHNEAVGTSTGPRTYAYICT